MLTIPNFQSYGVFQAYYQSILVPKKNPATIAWIGSFQIFLLFFMSIIVSPLIDKGRFRLCFNGGSFLLFISVLTTSFCTKFWQFLLVQGVLTGMGMGLIFGSGMVVLMSYFSKHVAIASGIGAAGGSVGTYSFVNLRRYIERNAHVELQEVWSIQPSPSSLCSKLDIHGQ